MQKSTSITETIEFRIDSLSYNGGRGVGRYNGVVVFVPGTAPGDLVRARVTARKPRYWEAEVVEILQPSEHRRQPPCPVAASCGGCSWQHVTYAAQVVQKQKILSDSLRGCAKLGTWEWLPFLSAVDEFHYRNRIQIQVRGGRKGFFAKRSNELVEVADCWIAEKPLNEKLQAFQPQPDNGRFELSLSELGEFSQVNSGQNEVLRRRVVEMIALEPAWIVDLYSGSGNLTLPIFAKFPRAKTVAVELNREAVRRGQATAKGIEWREGDVAQVMEQLPAHSGQGVVVLDPPRSGCASQVIEQILRLAPQQIIYVSCNPTTFARDAEKLLRSGAYRLESVQGLDMFPQTEHVELISSFRS